MSPSISGHLTGSLHHFDLSTPWLLAFMTRWQDLGNRVLSPGEARELGLSEARPLTLA